MSDPLRPIIGTVDHVRNPDERADRSWSKRPTIGRIAH